MAEADDEASLPVRDSDRESSATSQESLIQSTLIHAGKRCMVCLTQKAITWTPSSRIRKHEMCTEGQDVHHVQMCDIIAAHPSHKGNWRLYGINPNSTSLPTEFTAFTFKRVAGRKWKLRNLTFQCPSAEMCRQWLEHLRRLLEGMRHRPKYLKVFVNPFSGEKKAEKIFLSKVQPLWELAGIRTDVTVTVNAEHAPAAIRDLDFRQYDGIICVGGDGLFNQVINSLLVQTQLEAGVDIRRPRFIPARPRVKLGIIPAGSTDALCYTTTGTLDCETSAIRIALGDTRGVDVLSLQDRNQLLCFGVGMSYGFLGDVLERSENLRWMGKQRYNFAGFLKFLSLKSYACEVSFAESQKKDAHPRDNTICCSGCTVCNSSLDEDPLPSSPSLKGAMARAGDNEVITDQDPSAWQTLRGQFIGIQAFTTSSACKHSPRGVSPSAHLGDGCVDLLLVHRCSRLNYLRLLRRVKSGGDQFGLPFVDVHRVEEIRVRPLEDEAHGGEPEVTSSREHVNDTRPQRRRHQSVWNVDGEMVNQPEVEIRVHRQLLTLFTRGIESDDDIADSSS